MGIQDGQVQGETPEERVKDFLETLVVELDLDASVATTADDALIRAEIEGEDLGLLIGRHGSTLEAVQQIAYQSAFKEGDDRKSVVVDAAGYRKGREEVLQRDADRAALDAVKTEREVALDAMSATERKFVHEYLRENHEVETYSEGVEPERHLVVAPLASA